MIKISLVVPAYREELIIGQSLASIKDYLLEHSLFDTTEVVVVTADSTDKTQEITAQYAQQFKHFQHVQPGPKVGKGRDVKAGVQASKGEYIFFTDADLATPLHHLETAMVALEHKNYDMIIGVRHLANIHTGIRYYISNMANTLIQLVLLPGIKDSQCGFKGFKAPAAQEIFSRLTIEQWGFDMEIIKIAREHKYRIRPIIIDDWRDPKLESGLTGESALKAAFKTLGELFKIRMNSWRGKYS